jgi:hypothetical protein
MESTLHAQLKARFGPEAGGRAEVVVEGFRIDAIAPDGALVEVQTGALGPLRAKLNRLLPEYRVRVVKPVIVERRIIRRARRDGKDLSSRLSPKRGSRLDLFDDLVGLARIFPHEHLQIQVLDTAIEEIRLPRKRWPGFRVIDRSLLGVRGQVYLTHARDLWSLLPPDLVNPFSTLELSRHLNRSMNFAQRVAYCLRLSGAAEVLGKRGNRLVYVRKGRGRDLPSEQVTHECA